MKPSTAATNTFTIDASGSPQHSQGLSVTESSAVVDEVTTCPETGITFSVGSIRRATFRASDTVTTFKGFLAAYELDDYGSYRDKPLVQPLQLSQGQHLWLRDDDNDSEDMQDEGSGEEDVGDDSGDEGSSANSSSSMSEEGGSNSNDNDTSSDDIEARDGQGLGVHYPGLKGSKHVTRAPSRFTEAAFVKELETVGVGRPSTYSKVPAYAS